MTPLDRMVHELVMGGSASDEVPPYSSDMSAAWLVVERLLEQPYVKVNCSSSHYRGDHCSVVAPDESQLEPDGLVRRDALSVFGPSMPEAICRAALASTLPN